MWFTTIGKHLELQSNYSNSVILEEPELQGMCDNDIIKINGIVVQYSIQQRWNLVGELHS